MEDRAAGLSEPAGFYIEWLAQWRLTMWGWVVSGTPELERRRIRRWQSSARERERAHALADLAKRRVAAEHGS